MASLYERSGFLDLDGARVCVARLASTGAVMGRHALLLHGNPSNLDHFQALVPAVLRHAAATLFDHPGFGRSSGFAAGGVTLERSARFALAVLDAEGRSEPVDVIGHSHGALVAIAMAALVPGRVRSLVLLGSGGTPAHPGYRVLRRVKGLGTVLPALAARLYRAPRLGPLARRFTALAASSSFAPAAVPASFVDEEVRDLAARPELLRSMVELALDDPCRKVAVYAPRVRSPVLFHPRGRGRAGPHRLPASPLRALHRGAAGVALHCDRGRAHGAHDQPRAYRAADRGLARATLKRRRVRGRGHTNRPRQVTPCPPSSVHGRGAVSMIHRAALATLSVAVTLGAACGLSHEGLEDTHDDSGAHLDAATDGTTVKDAMGGGDGATGDAGPDGPSTDAAADAHIFDAHVDATPVYDGGCSTSADCPPPTACQGNKVCGSACGTGQGSCNGGCCSLFTCVAFDNDHCGATCTPCAGLTPTCGAGGTCTGSCGGAADGTCQTSCCSAGQCAAVGAQSCGDWGASCVACSAATGGANCELINANYVCGCDGPGNQSQCPAGNACHNMLCGTACDGQHPCNGGCCSGNDLATSICVATCDSGMTCQGNYCQ